MIASIKKNSIFIEIKWIIVSIIDDIRRFKFNKENLYYLFNRINKVNLEYSGSIDYSCNIYSLIESYCNVFCLTRASKKHIMTGLELSNYITSCDRIGVKIIGSKLITGSKIRASKNYSNLSIVVFRDILCEALNSDHKNVVPFLWYVYARYVSYKIDSVDRSGDISNSLFSTVFTDSYAFRNDNQMIATYSQHSCMVVVVHYGDGSISLGHWKKPTVNGKQAIYKDLSLIFSKHDMKAVYFIHNDPIVSVPMLMKAVDIDDSVEVYYHEKSDGLVYSVLSCVDNGSIDIKVESHKRSDSLIPYGPSVIAPRSAYKPVIFQAYKI